jgi:hypothetical protein
MHRSHRLTQTLKPFTALVLLILDRRFLVTLKSTQEMQHRLPFILMVRMLIRLTPQHQVRVMVPIM